MYLKKGRKNLKFWENYTWSGEMAIHSSICNPYLSGIRWNIPAVLSLHSNRNQLQSSLFEYHDNLLFNTNNNANSFDLYFPKDMTPILYFGSHYPI